MTDLVCWGIGLVLVAADMKVLPIDLVLLTDSVFRPSGLVLLVIGLDQKNRATRKKQIKARQKTMKRYKQARPRLKQLWKDYR